LNGGEVRVAKYKVDGLCCQTVYEVNGCYFHGCPKCMPKRKDLRSDPSFTADKAYQRAVDRRTFIESKGLVVVEKCECELEENVEVLRVLLRRLKFVAIRTLSARLRVHG